VDQEVAKTLGELELKLQELERELTTISHHDKPARTPAAAAESPHSSGRLIDEAVEHSQRDGEQAGSNAEDQAIAEGDGFAGAPVFGGEEIPAQAGATVERGWTVDVRETAYGEIPTPPSPPDAPGPPHTPQPHEPPTTPDPSPTPPGPPLPPPAPQPPSNPPSPLPPSRPPGMESLRIDLAELVRFRDRLAGTMNELIEEYSRLLSGESASHRRPDA
jgi:hypothetical protein